MSRKAIRQKTIRQKTIRLKTNDRTLDRYAHILKPLGYNILLRGSFPEWSTSARRPGD